MQRFFFHLVYDGRTLEDPEGSDLVDLDAASAEAQAVIRELAADHLMLGEPFFLKGIEIRSQDDSILTNVSVYEAIRNVMAPSLWSQNTSDGAP